MIPPFLLEKEPAVSTTGKGGPTLSFIDKTASGMAALITTALQQCQWNSRSGFMQQIDARVKTIVFLSFIVLISLLHSMVLQLVFFMVVFFLFLFSKIGLFTVFRKILLLSFFMGFLVFIPASLNVFTKGETILTLFRFESERDWWIYHIPANIAITKEGIILVLHLVFKIVNSLAVTFLLTGTTSFAQIIKALSALKVPGVFLLTLTLTYKYIFILSQTINDTYLALKMRWWGMSKVTYAEELVAGRVGYLFRKSWERYECTCQAMLARGFGGNVKFFYADKLKMTDYLFIASAIILFFSMIYLNFLYA